MTETPLPKVKSQRRVSPLVRLGRAYGRLVRLLLTLLTGLLLACLAILFVNYVVLSTAKSKAYRNLDPAAPVCREGLDHGWTELADAGRAALKTLDEPNDGGWSDLSDDELALVKRDKSWATKLSCALQRHIVPSTRPGGTPIDYHLGFLEFAEDGEPYALVSDPGRGGAVTSAMLQHAMETEMHTRHMSARDVKPVIGQLDILKKHLSTGAHYVIVFIHGWRHDARIGDNNVADLRLYTAHAARFVQQRCAVDAHYCNMDVTGIYIGWRGARVDERGLKDLFGEGLGGTLGNISAGATLFDRKPVSESVAPAAISALRSLEGVLSAHAGNKMLIVGHSLGGNMLATGLKDDLIKAVRRHKPGETLPPVLGDLVVLINPAAEANKWTAIQREVWSRTAFHVDANTSAADVLRDNAFFPPEQRPVIVSITAALAFPAGGLRAGDCAWIGLDFDDRFREAREKIRRRLHATDSMFDTGVDYDWATHDLFPTFKLDFRPAAAYLDRLAARIEGAQPKGQSCAAARPVPFFAGLEALPVRGLAVLASTFPFQHTDREESHTIGNLDPPRPASGVLADALPSAAPFGTTHEMLGQPGAGAEPHHPYATLADTDLDCPLTNRWLIRARTQRQEQAGNFWNSADLAPPIPGVPGQGEPAERILHGLNLTGIAPITRANDPFWNIRAFDNALSRHDGYRLSAFICAINQLALDDMTGVPAPMADRGFDPDRPMVDPNP